MEFARNFSDLRVYQNARELWNEVFHLSASFPKEERYSLTDQIRRSSRSVGAQIAEAWGKRKYQKHFISKLTDAYAELLETEHWLGVAQDSQYVSNDDISLLLKKAEKIEAMLNKMILNADSFCNASNSTVRESPSEYFAK